MSGQELDIKRSLIMSEKSRNLDGKLCMFKESIDMLLFVFFVFTKACIFTIKFNLRVW